MYWSMIIEMVPVHLGLVVAPQNRNTELCGNTDQPQKGLHCRWQFQLSVDLLDWWPNKRPMLSRQEQSIKTTS